LFSNLYALAAILFADVDRLWGSRKAKLYFIIIAKNSGAVSHGVDQKNKKNRY